MTSGQSEATKVVHSGEAPESLPQTVGPPVQRGSTVLLPNAAALYDSRLTTYGRSGLTTQETLASALAELEGATTVRLFPSGLAAVVGSMLAVLKVGDEVLVTETIYKPTRRFCDNVLKRYGVKVTYYPARATPAELMAMAGAATRLIVMESPGSLTFELQDAPGIAAAARVRGILTLMDNTWAAGWFFKPLAHDIGISVQALTKYVGGHADVFMGCAATRDSDIGAALDHAVWDFGWSVAPDDAYQILRGLRTLPTRLQRHQDSAMKVATWLQDQPEVSRVLYPALPSSPDQALWRRDYSGAAGLFAVVFKPVSVDAVDRFLDALSLFGLGFSWGGFESLALSADPQLDVREHGSPFDGQVVRLNIGLEHPADLIADLRAGIDAMAVA